MWIFCCGMVRSGSTLQFQIVADLVERAGLGKRVEWVEPEDFPKLRQKHRNYGRWKVLKTHACTDEMVSEFRRGRAKGVYVFRDVRDVTVSMMRTSGKSFDQLWDERLLDFCLGTFQQWTALPDVLVSRYEELLEDLPGDIQRIADHLSIPVDSATCKAIASDYGIAEQLGRIDRIAAMQSADRDQSWDRTYDSESLLHIDHITSGTSGQWREALLPAQVALIQSRAGEWLVTHGYELADTPEILQPLVKQLNQLHERFETCDADRAARLEQTMELGQLLEESEADRTARLESINRLTELLQESQADRAVRLEQIEELDGLLQRSEADRAARLESINQLTGFLQESEADRAARLENIDRLTELLQESEADRAARLENINRLTALLQESEADRTARLENINRLTALLQDSEADRAARLEIIRDQETRLAELEGELRALKSRAEVKLRDRIAQLLGG